MAFEAVASSRLRSRLLTWRLVSANDGAFMSSARWLIRSRKDCSTFPRASARESMLAGRKFEKTYSHGFANCLFIGSVRAAGIRTYCGLTSTGWAERVPNSPVLKSICLFTPLKTPLHVALVLFVERTRPNSGHTLGYKSHGRSCTPSLHDSGDKSKN